HPAWHAVGGPGPPASAASGLSAGQGGLGVEAFRALLAASRRQRPVVQGLVVVGRGGGERFCLGYSTVGSLGLLGVVGGAALGVAQHRVGPLDLIAAPAG